jgi:hypothetical protein
MFSRLLIPFIILTLPLFIGCSSQKPTFSKSFPDRYSLELPKKWKKKGKLLNAISEILPLVAKELEGKDFCLDCEAAYKVKFKLTDWKKAADGGYVGVYRFHASFTVYNEKNEATVRFIVVDPKEEEVLLYNGAAAPTSGPVSTTILQAEGQSSRLSVIHQPVYHGTPNRSSADRGTIYKNFLRHTENKIYKIRKMLVKRTL